MITVGDFTQHFCKLLSAILPSLRFVKEARSGAIIITHSFSTFIYVYRFCLCFNASIRKLFHDLSLHEKEPNTLNLKIPQPHISLRCRCLRLSSTSCSMLFHWNSINELHVCMILWGMLQTMRKLTIDMMPYIVTGLQIPFRWYRFQILCYPRECTSIHRSSTISNDVLAQYCRAIDMIDAMYSCDIMCIYIYVCIYIYYIYTPYINISNIYIYSKYVLEYRLP